jgi:hypothetical protein
MLGRLFESREQGGRFLERKCIRGIDEEKSAENVKGGPGASFPLVHANERLIGSCI